MMCYILKEDEINADTLAIMCTQKLNKVTNHLAK